MWLFFLISWCAIQIHPSFVKGCNEDDLANVEEIQKFQSIFPFLALKHEVFSVHGDKGDYIGELNCPSGLRHSVKVSGFYSHPIYFKTTLASEPHTADLSV